MGFILTNPFLARRQIIVLLTKRGQKGLVIPLPPITHTHPPLLPLHSFGTSARDLLPPVLTRAGNAIAQSTTLLMGRQRASHTSRTITNFARRWGAILYGGKLTGNWRLTVLGTIF